MKMIIILSCIMYLLISLRVDGFVNHNGDCQLWEYLSFEKKIKDHWKGRLLSELRWGNDMAQLYYGYGQAQLIYRKDQCEIAPGYRQAFAKAQNRWQRFHDPLVDTTLFFEKNYWEWEDRNRIIYHISEERSFLIYRNRLQLTTPSLLSAHDLKLFISDEVFFRESGGFDQNRLAVGLLAALKKSLNSRLFYIYRNLKIDNRWTCQNVIATQLYFLF